METKLNSHKAISNMTVTESYGISRAMDHKDWGFNPVEGPNWTMPATHCLTVIVTPTALLTDRKAVRSILQHERLKSVERNVVQLVDMYQMPRTDVGASSSAVQFQR